MRSKSARRGQATIVGLLVTVAIIMIVAWWIYLRPSGGGASLTPGETPGKPRFEGEAQTVLGQTLQKGEGTADRENLRQLRMQLQMEKQTNGEWPPALDRKWGLPLASSVSHMPFKYDPATGQVWDPTPGHEGF